MNIREKRGEKGGGRGEERGGEGGGGGGGGEGGRGKFHRYQCCGIAFQVNESCSVCSFNPLTSSPSERCRTLMCTHTTHRSQQSESSFSLEQLRTLNAQVHAFRNQASQAARAANTSSQATHRQNHPPPPPDTTSRAANTSSQATHRQDHPSHTKLDQFESDLHVSLEKFYVESGHDRFRELPEVLRLDHQRNTTIAARYSNLSIKILIPRVIKYTCTCLFYMHTPTNLLQYITYLYISLFHFDQTHYILYNSDPSDIGTYADAHAAFSQAPAVQQLLSDIQAEALTSTDIFQFCTSYDKAIGDHNLIPGCASCGIRHVLSYEVEYKKDVKDWKWKQFPLSVLDLFDVDLHDHHNFQAISSTFCTSGSPTTC